MMAGSCGQKSLITGLPAIDVHNVDADAEAIRRLRKCLVGFSPFWVKNIMSPSKLREKWDELVIRLGRSPVQRCVNHISEPDTEIPPGFRG